MNNNNNNNNNNTNTNNINNNNNKNKNNNKIGNIFITSSSGENDFNYSFNVPGRGYCLHNAACIFLDLSKAESIILKPFGHFFHRLQKFD